MGPKKSKIRILGELLIWQIREHNFNRMYYAYGLNLAERKQDDYIGRNEFLKLKNKVEKKLKTRAGCEKYEYNITTKDKFIANSILAANNIPCIENLALYSHSILNFKDGRRTGIDGFKAFKDVFIVKNIVLEASEGVLVCRFNKGKIEVNGILHTVESFSNLLGEKVWVVQRWHLSCKEIRQINTSALNTTRIVTILNDGNPQYLCGFQAFATGKASTDSWDKGSVYVGVDIQKECLKADGYCSLNDKEKSIVSTHPDSGICFDGYKLPGLRDALELCIKAHQLLYFSFVIGWDVAITDEGPLIVEANEKPGMNVVQCTDKGIRKEIIQIAGKYLKNKSNIFIGD